jgi:hypothetical protein
VPYRKSCTRTHSREIPAASDAPPRYTSRGFLHWRLSDDGPGASRIVPIGRHPKPFTISDMPMRHGDVNLAQRAQIVRHVDDFSAIGASSVDFIALPALVATRGRRTKGKLRWLPSKEQLRSRISANDGSVVGRLKQASFDHLVGLRESGVTDQQRKFCFYTGTSLFHLHQPRPAFSFAHRGWGTFINNQFSNPASRSARMPAAFSMAVTPIETAPAPGEATGAVVGMCRGG